MTFKRKLLAGHLAIAALSVLVPCGDAAAQGVFKCTEAGKTVYQAAPCAGQGTAIEIAPGPTVEQQQEAKTRANADKMRSGVYQPATRTPDQLTYRLYAPRKIDCAKLDQQRTTAYGRRNAALQNGRANKNSDQSSAVERDNNLIRSIEAEMMEGGCKPS